MDGELDEAGAMALWCASLPVLRERAAAGFWTDRLTRAEARMRDGASPLALCRNFGLTGPEQPPESRRAEPGPGVVLPPGLDAIPSTGRGNYRCPQLRCPRLAERDDRGRPPVCTLFEGLPMTPAP
ncbi:hypothetical protein ACFYYH_19170 [Streptomyces sp. NPDC002018]|uniref:hypothetical protein n=1 Tax=Streptomyces sp. NPDC002018 TaxID=3364629 RepID=UPI00368DEDDB